MNVHLLRNAKGEVMATFERNPKTAVHVEPVVAAGHSVEEVEAPDDYHMDLGAFYKKHYKPSR